MNIKEAQKLLPAVVANVNAANTFDDECVITRILGCRDAMTKNGPLPRFGVEIAGEDRPTFGFKSVVRGTLPDFVPAAGVHAVIRRRVVTNEKGTFITLVSLAFKFVDDARQNEINAKISALKGTGIAVAI